MRIIPRTMCTQHPDNANTPGWSSGPVIQGDDEILEAYQCFSQLGCREVMWDFEGKDVDVYVVRKLLAKYPEYFRENVIGEDVFITYRMPNPKLEEADKKLVMQVLETIPVAADAASRFYNREVSPVFEVIYPFVSSHVELLLTLRYYERVVVGKEGVELFDGVRVKEWLGEIKPKRLELIPLLEDIGSLLRIDQIIKGYIEIVRPRYVRVFVARSDPALNYGLVPATLLPKICVSRAKRVSEETGVGVYMIIGAGSPPFRGHLNPRNVDRVLEEYAGFWTFTIQSSFRYDHSGNDVKRAITRVGSAGIPEPPALPPDEEDLLVSVINKFMKRYQEEVEGLAPLVNFVSRLVPGRRARKLHVGLFGYSRGVGGIRLPRAIPFVCALYSIGIPPEILGLAALDSLTEEEARALDEYYINLRQDLADSTEYFCWECLDELQRLAGKINFERSVFNMVKEDLRVAEERLGIKAEPRSYNSRRHVILARLFILSLVNDRMVEAKRLIEEMARVRGFLG